MGGVKDQASLAGIVQDMLDNTARWTINRGASMRRRLLGSLTADLGATSPMFSPPSGCTRGLSTATGCR